MTAYIDDIIIQGTPEEIQKFLEMRGIKAIASGTQDFTICMECNRFPCACPAEINVMSEVTVPGGWTFTQDGIYSDNGNINFSPRNLHSRPHKL